MVSLVGYNISEYLFYIMLMYAMLFMALLAWYSQSILKGYSARQNYLAAGWFAGSFCMALLLNALPIRIGTVFFFDGVVFSVTIFYIWKLIVELRRWFAW